MNTKTNSCEQNKTLAGLIVLTSLLAVVGIYGCKGRSPRTASPTTQPGFHTIPEGPFHSDATARTFEGILNSPVTSKQVLDQHNGTPPIVVGFGGVGKGDGLYWECEVFHNGVKISGMGMRYGGPWHPAGTLGRTYGVIRFSLDDIAKADKAMVRISEGLNVDDSGVGHLDWNHPLRDTRPLPRLIAMRYGVAHTLVTDKTPAPMFACFYDSRPDVVVPEGNATAEMTNKTEWVLIFSMLSSLKSASVSETQPAPAATSQPATQTISERPQVKFVVLQVEGKPPHEWLAWQPDGQVVDPKVWREESGRVGSWLGSTLEEGPVAKLAILIHCPVADAKLFTAPRLLDETGEQVASKFFTWHSVSAASEWLLVNIPIKANRIPANASVSLAYKAAPMNRITVGRLKLKPLIDRLSATTTSPATQPAAQTAMPASPPN